MAQAIAETEIMDARIDALQEQLRTMASSVDRLASSVQLLADRDIRSQEREDVQRSFNMRIGEEVKKVTQEVAVIQLARAEEKHAVDAVKRSYPWLVILALVGPIAVTIVANNFFKPQEPQRAVVPLVQPQYPSQAQP